MSSNIYLYVAPEQQDDFLDIAEQSNRYEIGAMRGGAYADVCNIPAEQVLEIAAKMIAFVGSQQNWRVDEVLQKLRERLREHGMV